jgi:hypothetical protein
MSTKKKSYSSRIRDLITNIDSYGTPINLTYNRKTTFQSFIGGSVTLICKFVISIFLILKLNSVYNKDSTIQNYSFVRDLYTDGTSYSLTYDVIDFGIRIFNE